MELADRNVVVPPVAAAAPLSLGGSDKLLIVVGRVRPCGVDVLVGSVIPMKRC